VRTRSSSASAQEFYDGELSRTHRRLERPMHCPCAHREGRSLRRHHDGGRSNQRRGQTVIVPVMIGTTAWGVADPTSA